MELSRIARVAAGVGCVGASALHVAAAAAHGHHAPIALFFGALAALQAMVGAAALSAAPFPVAAAALLNGGAASVWLISRTTGIPFVEGAEAVEQAAFPDTVATLLELTAMTAAGIVRRLEGMSFPITVPRLREAGSIAIVAVAIATGAGASDLARGGHDDSNHGDNSNTAVATGASGHGHDPAAAAADRHEHGGPADSIVAQRAHDAHPPTTAATSAAHNHPTTSTAAQGTEATPAGSTGTRPAASQPPSPSTPGTSATLRYGPFVLPPGGVGEAGHFNLILTGVEKPCTDCYLTSLRPDLVYADGARANYDTGPMLHHAVWFQTGSQDPTCPGNRGERFFASGNERTPINLPDGFGVPVSARPWDLVVEIMNHAPTGQTVYIELGVVHRPMTDQSIRSVRSVWMDIAACRQSKYAVPAGPHTATWRWTSTLTGRIVAAGGHVHDGGIKTVLNNATTNAGICTSWAGYGRDPSYQGSIESMSTCSWDRLGTIRAGETLELQSHYDSADAQPDAMGIMIAYVYPTPDLAGGTEPPPSDASPGSGSDAGSPPPPRHDH